MTRDLPEMLSSSLFSVDDVTALLAEHRHQDQHKPLEPVRAESLDRFLDVLGAIFAGVDWSGSPSVLDPGLSLVGFPSLDHLTLADVLTLRTAAVLGHPAQGTLTRRSAPARPGPPRAAT